MTQGDAKKVKAKRGFFEQLSVWVSQATGTTGAFIGAAGLILVWLISGPFFGYSETWQLFINTGTTIITFLMVFVIQRAQNKDSVAIHLKLNELVAAHELSSNRLVGVEDLTEDELQVLQKYYRRLAEMAKTANNLQESHSIEEAEAWHQSKSEHRSTRRKSKKKEINDPPKGGHIISSSE
jgi:low affinity Fe/Cu permease